MSTLKPQDDEASDEVILEALARRVGRDDAHARLIRALAGRVYVEQQDRYHWRAVAELRAAQMRDAGRRLLAALDAAKEGK